MQQLKAILLLSIFVLLHLCTADIDNSFDYSNQGQDWDDTNCVNLAKGMVMNLSPIDLNTTAAQGFGYPYYFLPAYTGADATVNNLNITLELNSTNFGNLYTITAGKLAGIYQAVSMRLHSEAEHTFAGKRYPVELQIYHQVIHSRQSAEKYQANLFVSIFFDNSTDNRSNDLLANITGALTNQQPTTYLDLSYLFDLTATRDLVYSYAGTQTIPPCYPASWILFPTPQHASAEQIQQIYDLYHNNPNFIGPNGNYREIPPSPQPVPGVMSGYFILNNPKLSEMAS